MHDLISMPWWWKANIAQKSCTINRLAISYVHYLLFGFYIAFVPILHYFLLYLLCANFALFPWIPSFVRVFITWNSLSSNSSSCFIFKINEGKYKQVAHAKGFSIPQLAFLSFFYDQVWQCVMHFALLVQL